MAGSEEDACYLYSPCSLFQQFIKACFNCFGHDQEHDHEQHSTTPTLPLANSASGTEMKSTEGEIGVESRAIRVTRRPPRPPINSGGGGQIN